MRNEHQAHANGYFDLSSFDTDVGVRFGLAEEGRGGWGGTRASEVDARSELVLDERMTLEAAYNRACVRKTSIHRT